MFFDQIFTYKRTRIDYAQLVQKQADLTYLYLFVASMFGLRPYHAESTGSRPITEVKPRRAWLVLGWATA